MLSAGRRRERRNHSTDKLSGAAGAPNARTSEPTVCGPCDDGVRRACCARVWRHAVCATCEGRPGAVARAAVEGDDRCRPERRDIARRPRRGVRLICGLFFASVPENDGSRTSHLATARSRRTRDDHVARNGQEPLRDRASRRFLWPKSLHPRFHAARWHEPRRLAADLPAIAKPKARFGQKTPTAVRFIQASPPETVSASRSSAGGLSARCRPRRRSDALETLRMRLQLGQSIGESLCTQGAVKLHPSTGKHVESDEPLLGRSIMGRSEGYGQRLAERLRAEQTHAIVTRVLRTADMAVTETRCDNPVLGLSHSIQREDAYLVALTLRDFPNRQYWEDGRQMPVCDMRTGQVDFHDLKRDPVALLDKPYHDPFLYLARSALGAT